MFSKLRSNYNLCNLLVRIFFVLSFVASSWQRFLGVSALLFGEGDLALALLSALVLAVILQVLVPVAVNFFINATRLYSLPRAEYVLLVNLFVALYYFGCALLNVVNFFTPLLLTWGAVVFPFVVSLICVWCFYELTVKLYFNDVTEAYYFRCIATVYLAFAFLLGVIL